MQHSQEFIHGGHPPFHHVDHRCAGFERLGQFGVGNKLLKDDAWREFHVMLLREVARAGRHALDADGDHRILGLIGRKLAEPPEHVELLERHIDVERLARAVSSGIPPERQLRRFAREHR